MIIIIIIIIIVNMIWPGAKEYIRCIWSEITK